MNFDQKIEVLKSAKQRDFPKRIIQKSNFFSFIVLGENKSVKIFF